MKVEGLVEKWRRRLKLRVCAHLEVTHDNPSVDPDDFVITTGHLVSPVRVLDIVVLRCVLVLSVVLRLPDYATPSPCERSLLCPKSPPSFFSTIQNGRTKGKKPV